MPKNKPPRTAAQVKKQLAREAGPLVLFGIEHTNALCPSCLAVADTIRRETLMPIPKSPRAPLSAIKSVGSICFDCAAAEGLSRKGSPTDFHMARIAVGNDRQGKLRLPGVSVLGIPTVRASFRGDLERLHDWQDKHVEPHLGCDVEEES